MRDKLRQIRSLAMEALKNTGSPEELEVLRVRFLGKKGELTQLLRQMGSLSPEERPLAGQMANEVRTEIEQRLSERISELQSVVWRQRLKREKIDVTMPKKHHTLGKRHPLSIVSEEIQEVFVGLGFQIAEGPEIEYAYYNFDALNTPKNYPTREPSDTFYVSDDIVLRTQTSPVQVRVMENSKPPIRVISPGRVYRADAVDATHSPLFHQIEGLVVDKGICMSDLKGTLEVFLKKLYGEKAVLRFRPHHFSFTEPSAEVDIGCFSCGGKGCRLCKNEGWIEILGCGMVHPNVLRCGGIDPEIYSGFAFGMGLERVAMRRFNIDDLRLFYENDLRFLGQF